MKALLKIAVIAALCSAASAEGASIFAPRGQKVYETTCVVCHSEGISGAPRFGDKSAWAPRVVMGKETLVKSALKGKGLMPPKGSNPDFSEEDIKAAVDYMTSAVK